MLGALGCVRPDGKYHLNRMHAIVAGGRRKARQVTDHCHIPNRPFGTHAYVLSRRGAQKLLDKAAKAAAHVDAVAWGIKDLQLLLTHPMLAYQGFEEPSTIGSITDGWEESLPNWVVDEYTHVTFKWAFNEPVIRIPGLNVLLSVGRALSSIGIGFIAGSILTVLGKAKWFLPLHCTSIAVVFIFLRLMNMPQPLKKLPQF